MRFQHLTAKGFLKSYSDQFAMITDTSGGCRSLFLLLKTAAPPRKTLKTTLCSMNLCTRGRSPKAASDRSRCPCLVYLFTRLCRDRKRSFCIYLSLLPSFGLFAPCLCTVPLAYRRTTSLPLRVYDISLRESALLFSFI